MIVFTDIHGNFDTFIALYNRIPQEKKDAGIAIAGDLIDRGPKSRQMIQWCINHPEVKVVKGNHEFMMLASAKEQANTHKESGNYKYGMCGKNALFLSNGGVATMDSYLNSDNQIDTETLDKHLEWMEALPIYLEFKDVKNDKGEHLLVTHSSAASAWKWSEQRREEQHKVFIELLTWGRPRMIHPIKGIYNIFGHTPTKNGPKVKSHYSNIDTGCYYDSDGYFELTAIEFPSMQVWSQENIDMVKEEF